MGWTGWRNNAVREDVMRVRRKKEGARDSSLCTEIDCLIGEVENHMWSV
jgi:hypothetical protein